jgi:hypothetical protein
MDTGELIRAALKMYWKSFWPLWAIFTPISLGFDLLFKWFTSRTQIPEAIWGFYFLIMIFLPALFIGPAMLNISNVILERPGKTLTSFGRGMSPGMILKIFLFFAPVIVLILILRYGNIPGLSIIFTQFGVLFLIFNIPLLFLTPLWIFYPMILLLEKKSILQSVRRLRIFASGQFRKLVPIQVLLVLITVILIPLGGYIYRSIYPEEFSTLVTGVLEDQHWAYLPWIISNCLFYIVTIPFGIGITTYVLHYYQVRAAKENFNEELLAQELGYQPIEEMMTV